MDDNQDSPRFFGEVKNESSDIYHIEKIDSNLINEEEDKDKSEKLIKKYEHHHEFQISIK